MYKLKLGSQLSSILNIGLRVLSMISKFILIFFLGKFLNPEDVGTYGLITAIVGYSIYALGFEFYSYATRELILSSELNIKQVMQNQFVFYLIMYMILSPVLFLIFYQNIVPFSFFIYVLPIVILEHANQEFHRILIALKKPLYASFIFFIRTGIWSLICILIMKLNTNARNLQLIFILWGASGIIVSILALYKLKLYLTGPEVKINWKWIFKGIKIALPFLIASLSFRGIFTLDRFFIENSFGLSTLGAYVIYISMATSVMSFIDAGIIDFSLPKIIAVGQSDPDKFKILMITFSKNVIILSILFPLLCWLIGKPIIDWYGNPIYLEYFFTLKWLLLAIFIYALSTIPHVALYALGHDKPIIFSSIFGFLIFYLFVKYFTPNLGIHAVLLALCLGFLSIFIWKLVALIIIIKGKSL